MDKIQNRQRISYFSVGPCYVTIITLLAVVGIHISKMGYLSGGYFEFLRTPMSVMGTIVLGLALFLCIETVKTSRLFQQIRDNKLITTGVFAWVRNPLYTGITLIVIGFILRNNNLFLLPLIFIYWGAMTRLVKREEEDLEKIYGEEYRAYKSRVNCCIPWFPDRLGYKR
ncbi:isoprenylcysteine carboxylmethyltransferase family protein [Desulfitobacterium sp.]|uniref:methyltransferase family protein n=1 Tax=Desulfitobacterium sp. TaxID=49981 RepID=UPI002B217EBE|nr:isoprenylcysteine carboxylmethyltransferase family protein [Desulfitobacterium sp.]MEA4902896.1 isoprenylcysteine carboxylmethyltransferase family protein [Desulfitobacterium sp.]